MRFRTLAALSVLVFSMFLRCPSRADGGFMPNEWSWAKSPEHSLINEPEQKAAIFFAKGKERLIISPSFEGSAGDFAWVVPVPARPAVRIIKGSLFHELKDIAVSQLQEIPHRMSAKGPSGSPDVNVMERKTVGAYDVSVLSSTDGKALIRWLKANKYHVPEKAGKITEYYTKKKWVFVASRIKAPGDSKKGLRDGTLAPLSLEFPSKHPIYPMRMSAINPGQFKVVVYLLLPSDEFQGRVPTDYYTALLAMGPLVFRSTSYLTKIRPNSRKYLIGPKVYPTLDKLSRDELTVCVLTQTFSPSDCTEDITWSL